MYDTDFLPDGLIRFNIVILQRKDDSGWQSAVSSTLMCPQISSELEQQLVQAGFQEIHTCGSTQGEQFSSDSRESQLDFRLGIIIILTGMTSYQFSIFRIMINTDSK